LVSRAAEQKVTSLCGRVESVQEPTKRKRKKESSIAESTCPSALRRPPDQGENGDREKHARILSAVSIRDVTNATATTSSGTAHHDKRKN